MLARPVPVWADGGVSGTRRSDRPSEQPGVAGGPADDRAQGRRRGGLRPGGGPARAIAVDVLGLIVAAALGAFAVRDLVAPVRLAADGHGVTVVTGFSRPPPSRGRRSNGSGWTPASGWAAAPRSSRSTPARPCTCSARPSSARRATTSPPRSPRSAPAADRRAVPAGETERQPVSVDRAVDDQAEQREPTITSPAICIAVRFGPRGA